MTSISLSVIRNHVYFKVDFPLRSKTTRLECALLHPGDVFRHLNLLSLDLPHCMNFRVAIFVQAVHRLVSK